MRPWFRLHVVVLSELPQEPDTLPLRLLGRGTTLLHVGHYWLAHPHHTKQLLQVYRWHEQGYLLVLTAGAGNIVRAEPFDAVELDITRVLAWPAGTAPLP